MPDGDHDSHGAPVGPTAASRLKRAALRGLPAVLIAAAIWLWFDLARRDCDARVRAWTAEFARSLARGETAFPAPATISEWIEPTLRTMLSGLGNMSEDAVRFVPADPQVDSRSPVVELAAADGAVVLLRCRCAGDSIEIVGIERR